MYNNILPHLCKNCGKTHNRTYGTLHVWIFRNKPKTGVCEHCDRKTRTHWANIDHVYCDDLTEWIELCPMCHTTFDRVMGNAKIGFGRMLNTEEKLRKWRNSLKSYRKALPRLRTYAWFTE